MKTHFFAPLMLAFGASAIAGGNDCSSPEALGNLQTQNVFFDTTGNSTSGFNGGAACVPEALDMGPDIFYELVSNVQASYRFTTEGSSYDTKLSVHDGAGCAATCLDYNDDVQTSITWSEVTVHNVEPGQTLLIQVGGWNGDSGAGQLNVYIEPCNPGTFTDTALEPNNSCNSPALVSPGLNSGLSGSSSDEDWYFISVPPNHTTTVQGANMINEFAEFEAYVNCGPQVGGGSMIVYSNTSAVTESLHFRVTGVGGVSGCWYYDLDVSLNPISHCGLGVDLFEDNNSCLEAAPLSANTHTDLTVSEANSDYFSFCVEPGATMDFSVTFDHSVADIDVRLWDTADVGCGTNGVPLFTAESTTNDEIIDWTNTSASSIDVIMEVYVWDTNPAEECNLYNIESSGGFGFGCDEGTFTTFCVPMNPNSTGLSTDLVASYSFISLELSLYGYDGPPGQLGYFLMGTGAVEPGISLGNGRLCLDTSPGNQVGRYNVSGGEFNSIGVFDSSGFLVNIAGNSAPNTSFTVPNVLPLAGMPTIQAGERYYFQLWHREDGGQSNFSSGLSYRF